MNKEKWKAFLELGRVSNLPTCISNTTVGYYLAGGNLLADPFLWLMAILAISCFYESGMILNDLFDYSVDLRERPHRPIPSGRINAREAFFVYFILVGIGLFIVRTFIPNAIPVALILLALTVIYNGLHQKLNFSPLIMGACRGSIYLLSAAAAGWHFNSEHPALWLMSCTLMIYISSVSFIARDELQNQVSTKQKIFLLLALVAIFIPLLMGQINFLRYITFIVAIGWISWISARFINQRISPMGAVGKMLAGMSLLDALILAEVESPLGVLVAWGCFLGTLNWHRKLQGT